MFICGNLYKLMTFTFIHIGLKTFTWSIIMKNQSLKRNFCMNFYLFDSILVLDIGAYSCDKDFTDKLIKSIN